MHSGEPKDHGIHAQGRRRLRARFLSRIDEGLASKRRRTRSSPLDPLSQLRLWCGLGWGVFSLASGLPSPTSADGRPRVAHTSRRFLSGCMRLSRLAQTPWFGVCDFPTPASVPWTQVRRDWEPSLRERATHGKVSVMSAMEILEQVKALPPRERRKLFAGMRQLETALEVEPAAKHEGPVRWPDATARRRRILGDRVLPNLVLLAREEDRY